MINKQILKSFAKNGRRECPNDCTTLTSNSGNKVAGQAALILCPPTGSPTEHKKAHLRQLHVPRFPFTTRTTRMSLFKSKGSYQPFYSIKQWGTTPLVVYKLKVPTPLKHYNLNIVASNQNPEINRNKK